MLDKPTIEVHDEGYLDHMRYVIRIPKHMLSHTQFMKASEEYARSTHSASAFLEILAKILRNIEMESEVVEIRYYDILTGKPLWIGIPIAGRNHKIGDVIEFAGQDYQIRVIDIYDHIMYVKLEKKNA